MYTADLRMETVGNIGSRRRAAGNHYSAEEQALDQIAKEAESRLAARRQARAEAREIRMKELEKQQKEMEENADRQFVAESAENGMPKVTLLGIGNRNSAVGSLPPSSVQGSRPVLPSTGSFQSSRRGSEDSVEDLSCQPMTLRDLRHELKELEEKFRKAMVQNAQSDNEKASLMYQVELFKDRIEDIEEAQALLQKENKDKHRECEELKRDTMRMQQELNYHRYLLEERDRMIKEHGLVLTGEEDESDDRKLELVSSKTPVKALVSSEVATLLDRAGEGSLDGRIRRLIEEKNELNDQLRRLKLDMEEERTRPNYRECATSPNAVSPNGPVGDLADWQKDAVSRQVNEYKVKLQKSDQEIATLQATVARLETQVTRYRSTAETLEKSEDELKVEKRKLQRELRETQTKLEELETSHNHLQRRLDKLKTAKSALLKDI